MEIRVPEVGESVHEALLAKWFKKSGEAVKKDEPLCEIETDKITLDIHADAAGILTTAVSEGQTVSIGAVIGSISEQGGVLSSAAASINAVSPGHREEEKKSVVSSPAVRQEMRDKGIDPGTVTGTGKGGRITLDDLFSRIEGSSRRTETEAPENIQEVKPAVTPADIPQPQPPNTAPQPEPSAKVKDLDSVRSEEAPKYAVRPEERRPMSPIRKRIAERLLTVRQQTAMLTTFNEADLSQIKALREKHREHFQNRHGIALGYMPFFVKACVEALRQFPIVNASIDGEDLVLHHYFDIGIAIGSEKGLVVPILRDADRLRLYEIEQAIVDFVEKIKTNRLAIADLQGGTFSISNGGVYGSLLSTPILNPPQSAVLGMHAIQDRPVVREGQIVIRPMMYLALSYDHRIIDGREAVGFLKKLKEYIEDPEELLLEG
ncbi:MAG TPA: 2-oxoglutarate dehydrogenase complex dihydrolipoyllysine-residue succinyltransferase [Desulfuromonadaceae bacterium]